MLFLLFALLSLAFFLVGRFSRLGFLCRGLLGFLAFLPFSLGLWSFLVLGGLFFCLFFFRGLLRFLLVARVRALLGGRRLRGDILVRWAWGLGALACGPVFGTLGIVGHGVHRLRGAWAELGRVGRSGSAVTADYSSAWTGCQRVAFAGRG
ncbi:MAG: hypothetical protein ACLF0G_07815 [Candidatus Brocadiia bacterium]